MTLLTRLTFGAIGLGIVGGAVACGSSDTVNAPVAAASPDGGNNPTDSSNTTEENPGTKTDPDGLEPNPPGAPYLPFGDEGVLSLERNAVRGVAPGENGGLLATDGSNLYPIDKGGKVGKPIDIDKEITIKAGPHKYAYVSPETLAAQGPDAVLLAGSFVRPQGSSANLHVAAIRLSTQGKVDESFGENGIAAAGFDLPVDLQRQSFATAKNGSFVFGVQQASGGSEPRTHLLAARFDVSGALKGKVDVDLSTLGDRAQVSSIALQDDGKVLIGSALGAAKALPIVVRLTKSGELDDTFGDNGVAYVPNESNKSVSSLALQSDGKVLAAGLGHGGVVVARFDAKGQPDKSFGLKGKALIPALTTGDGFITSELHILVAADGKIVVVTGTAVAGADDKEKKDVRAARLGADGKPDTSFGANGVSVAFSKAPAADTMTAATILPTGLIVLGGYRVDDPYREDSGRGGRVFALAP